MTDIPTITSLLERVEKATGPDRKLDGEIFAAFETYSYGDVIPAAGGMVVYAGPAPHAPGQGRFEVAPKYTSSLDAALALVEEKMKVCAISTSMDPSGCGATLVWWPDGLGEEREVKAEGCGWTMSQAVLSALLRALIAQKETADV
jgi:hypothetical protein